MKAVATITAVIAALAMSATAAAIPDPGSVSGYDARAISQASQPQAESPYLSLRANDQAHNQAAAEGNPLTQLRQADDAAAAAAANAALNADRLVVVHDNDGYHWLDAGEGFAAGIGFAAILAALALIIRSRRVEPVV